MEDFELLQAYVKEGAEDAFTELVNRHINLVYSAALRQAQQSDAAAEIAQSVFVILAHKASGLPPGTVLAGWLIRTTYYTAANARRRDQRRRMMEQEAMEHLYSNASEESWEKIVPFLDEALITLRDSDRAAVALRFFEGKSFKEIGAALSLSEDNARKRVTRAVEKLHGILVKKGQHITAAALAGALGAFGAKAAPSGLGSSIAAGVLVKAAAGSATLPVLANLTLATLRWVSLKPWLMFATATLAVCAISVVLRDHAFSLGVGNIPQAHASATRIDRTNETGVAPKNVSEPKAGQSKGKRKMLFRVVDSETGKPIDHVRLTLDWFGGSDRQSTVAMTSQTGDTNIPTDFEAKGNWCARVEVYKDGYVPKYVSWSSGQGDTYNDIPATYTTKLTKAVTIGGVVANENNAPIPGVKIVFSVSGPSPGASNERERLTMMGDYHTEVTDAKGQWQCRHVPSDFSMIGYEPRHSYYMGGFFGSTKQQATITNQGIIYLTEESLRANAALMVLRAGNIIKGTVVDENGNPVAGARVTRNHDWHNEYADLRIGQDGGFEIQVSPDKESLLTFQADNFAPREITIPPGGKLGSTQVALTHGVWLRARVLDEKGQAVQGAEVRISPDSANRDQFNWHAQTDNEGYFEWNCAPSADLPFSVEATGYDPATRARLATNGAGERYLTLKRSSTPDVIHVSGHVIDAESRQPIKSFRVLVGQTSYGVLFGGQRVLGTSEPRMEVLGKGGDFTFSRGYEVHDCIVQIEADGYFPVQQKRPGQLTNDWSLAFELRRAKDVQGQVQWPDGRPVPRVTVMVCTEKEASRPGVPGHVSGVYMRLGGQFDLTHSQAVPVETDAQGRFAFTPKLGMKKLVVAHKDGFGQVTLEDPLAFQKITLELWGRIEGQLKIGNKPGTNCRISLGSSFGRFRPSECVYVAMETTTDNEGNFVFEGVPPMEVQVSHLLNADRKPGPLLFTQTTAVKIKPGETARVIMGGVGMRVTGKFKLAGGSESASWGNSVLRPDAPRPPAPKKADFSTTEEFDAAQKEWYASEIAFWRSEEGLAVQARHQYSFLIGQDGTFVIEDVLPGLYKLEATRQEPGRSFAMPMGFFTKVITVPETGDTLDLGEIEQENSAP